MRIGWDQERQELQLLTGDLQHEVEEEKEKADSLAAENEKLQKVLQESQRLQGVYKWQLERYKERAVEDWKKIAELDKEKKELEKEVERLEDMEMQRDNQLLENVAVFTDMAKVREDLLKARGEVARWEARALAAERGKAAGK